MAQLIKFLRFCCYVGFCLLVFVILYILIAKSDIHQIKKTNDNYYTYAIIFYPDKKTSVEGYVDKYIWGNDFVKITIDGEEYTTSPENCVIVKRKDLIVNKEADE